MSPIEVAHSLPTGAAIARVAAEGYDLGSAVRAWAISRGLTDHYAVEAGGRRYVLRLYPTHWRTRADVLFELDFIRHAAARGVPVAAPLPRRDGGWLTEVDAPEGPRLAVLFVHAAGDEWVPRHEREAHAAAYGEAAARLHNACDDFAIDRTTTATCARWSRCCAVGSRRRPATCGGRSATATSTAATRTASRTA